VRLTLLTLPHGDAFRAVLPIITGRMSPNLVSLFALKDFLLTGSLEIALKHALLELLEISQLDFAKKNAHSQLFLTL
jgi:hypothetical protein